MASIPSLAPIICIRYIIPLLCCTNNLFCTYINIFSKISNFVKLYNYYDFNVTYLIKILIHKI